uniref:NADH-ubiquinone oxidoreductase chain 4L n=1 Tax=Zaptyx exulans TaxID=1885849 RepID=A0A224A1Z3_9EUPU|nr:NADH dehydrogenase subunit 4L [Zaptyx exulans]
MLTLLKFSLFMLLVSHFYLYSTYSHYLSALLILESMVLILLIFVVTFSFSLLEGLMIYLFVLTLSVCEAALGLTLLISLVKLSGNDLITTFSSSKMN